MKYLSSSLLISLFICSCSSESEPQSNDYVCPWETTPQLTLSQSEESSLKKFSGFGIDFINAFADSKYAKETPNFAVSPISLTEASAMLANASNDDYSRRSIVEALGFESISQLNNFNEKLMRYLPNNEDGNLLSMVNSFWYNNEFHPTSVLLSNLEQFYMSSIKSVDFSSDKTTDLINQWAKEQTKGLISRVIKRTDYSPSSPFILANAMYFSGEWNCTFDEKDTRTLNFTTYEGKTVSTKMMTQNITVGSVTADSFKVVRLYYKGQAKYMDVILPDEGVDVYDVAKTMDAEQYVALSSKLMENRIKTQIILPVFEIAGEYNLTSVMSAMGMNLENMAFNESGFNLEQFSITTKQFNVLKVHEKGSVAASVTVTGADTGMDLAFDYFKVDRPFMFIIGDEETDIVLMAGVVTNPEE